MNQNRKTYRERVAREFRNIKQAGLPSTDVAYERVLVRLGMGVIQEQLPEIMPYFVGSSFLDKSDDGQFAAGFFIFDLQGSVCDIPIFLIDGTVKGYQMLFVRSSKVFLPAKAEVVDFVIGQQRRSDGNASFGEGETRDRATAMNTRVYSDQNRYLSKHSGFESLQETLEVFADIATSHKTASIYKTGTDHKCLPSANWVELLASRKAAGWLMSATSQSPRLEHRVARLLGGDWRTKLAGFHESRRQFVHDCKTNIRFGQTGIKLGQAVKPAAKIAMFRNLDLYRTDIDRQPLFDELQRYGAVYEDYRDQQTCKKAYLVQDLSKDYISPIGSGKYPVVLANGSECDCWVVIARDQINSDNQGCSLVISVGDNAVGSVVSNEVAARVGSTDLVVPEQYGKGFYEADGLTSLGDSVELDRPFLLVTPAGKLLGPVTAEKKNADGSFQIRQRYLDRQGNRSSNKASFDSTPEYPAVSRIGTLAINQDGKLKRHRLTSVDDSAILQVPQGCRILYVSESADRDPSCCGNWSSVKDLRVMPISDLTIEQITKSASFSVKRISPNHFDVSGRTVEARELPYRLMEAGLSKQASLEIVDQVVDTRKSFIITDRSGTIPQVVAGQQLSYKLAYQDGRDPGYSFRQPSSQEAGTYDARIPVREQNPVNESIPTDQQRYADTSRPPWSSENADYTQPQVSEPASPQEAEQLSRTPDLVFENSLFTQLARHVNPLVERERLVSGLFKTCDTAGRGLFLLYSHGDEFTELYGESDSSKMENQLLTIFEVAGKQLVTLFSRSISSGADLQMSSFIDA